MTGIERRTRSPRTSPRVLELVVRADGTLAFLWDDRLQPLSDLGEVSIRRASHVEPSDGGWTADLSPVGGPRLGPFRLRGDALAAEREWLRRHLAADGAVAVTRSPPRR